MNFQLQHPRDQLVAIMNRIYHNSMTTFSGGNLSIKEDNGDIQLVPIGEAEVQDLEQAFGLV